MSKELLKTVFEHLTDTEAWSLQLLKVTSSVANGTTYYSREICLEPKNRVQMYVEEIRKFYLGKNGIESYNSVDEYTGDVVGKVIYSLPVENPLIADDYIKLIHTIATPDKETPLEEQKKYKAYLLTGSIRLNDELAAVKLFSMQSPLTIMTNKFLLYTGSTFRDIDKPILSLKKTIDAVIIGDKFYLFTLQAENLFNLERTYKAICTQKVQEIVECDFLTNNDSFIQVATSGQNPRRFVSYDENHLTAMKDKTTREKIAVKFGIALKGDKIDTDADKASERLVKLLCNKGKIDPFDELPVEVAAAKKWE